MEPSSIHCASSMRHTSGWSSVMLARSPSTASPTRNRLGVVPSRSPNATDRASLCGSGSSCSRPIMGAHTSWRVANGSSISDSMPATLDGAESHGTGSRVIQQSGLADAGLTAENHYRAVSCPCCGQYVIKGGQLVVPTQQPAL